MYVDETLAAATEVRVTCTNDRDVMPMVSSELCIVVLDAVV